MALEVDRPKADQVHAAQSRKLGQDYKQETIRQPDKELLGVS